jgi:hypothetical protein
MRRISSTVGLFALAACGSEVQCVYYPCPAPFAVRASVTAANGAQLTGVFTATSSGSNPCQAGTPVMCLVPGGPGHYEFDVGAPGFKTVHRSVDVGGTGAGCNTCGNVETQQIAVVLDPA